MTRKLTNEDKLKLQHQEIKDLYIDIMQTMQKSLYSLERILDGVVAEPETVEPVVVEPVEPDILTLGYEFRLHGADLQIVELSRDRTIKVICQGVFKTRNDGFVSNILREFHIERQSIEEIVLAEKAAAEKAAEETKALEDEALEAENLEDEAKEKLETEEVA